MNNDLMLSINFCIKIHYLINSWPDIKSNGIIYEDSEESLNFCRTFFPNDEDIYYPFPQKKLFMKNIE